MPLEASLWLQAGMLKQGQSGFNTDTAAATAAAACRLTGTPAGFIYDKKRPGRRLSNISEQHSGCRVKI